MNAKTLALFVALQLKIREAMGPWRVLDGVCYEVCGKRFLYGIVWEIRNKDNTWEAENRCLIIRGGNGESDWFPLESRTLIRIPLTCDDSSEEAHKRSLVGMCGGFEFMGYLHGKAEVCVLDNMHQRHRYHADTLTEALLLALAAKWGIKGEVE